MDDQSQKILISADLRPAYYDNFHCIMGKCKFNCCDDNWKIEFSKKDYLTIKQVPKSPEMEELTRRCVRRLHERAHDDMYAEFRSDEETDRCAFHTPEGLCRLQLECGEKSLPYVCRIFPRFERYLPSAYLERSLSLGCEGVLELLWDLQDGIEFRSDRLPLEQQRVMIVSPETPMLLWLATVREWCIDLLQNRSFTLPQRILLMGMGLRELVDNDLGIQAWSERVADLSSKGDLAGLIPSGNRELTLFLSNCTYTLLVSTITNPALQNIKGEIITALNITADKSPGRLNVPLASYQKARARYEDCFRGREFFMENIITAVFFHLHMPDMDSKKKLWDSYMEFCAIYAFFRFLAVMSCREGSPGDRDSLFQMIVLASRILLHNPGHREKLKDKLLQTDSATLAHMAILLCG